MHRNELLNQIHLYKKSKWCLDEDIGVANLFIQFITNNDRCFDRELGPGHLTASCWLWNSDQSAALFTLHKKLKCWLQLGGHADGHPNLLEVALKEAKEESGLDEIEVISPEIFDLSIHRIPANPKEKAHFHYDVRYLLIAKNQSIQMSDESLDLRWIEPSQFKNYKLDDSILKMFKKAELAATHKNN